MNSVDSKQVKEFSGMFNAIVDKFKDSPFLAFSALGVLAWIISLFFDISKTEAYRAMFYIIIIAPLFMQYMIAKTEKTKPLVAFFSRLGDMLGLVLVIALLVFLAENDHIKDINKVSTSTELEP